MPWKKKKNSQSNIYYEWFGPTQTQSFFYQGWNSLGCFTLEIVCIFLFIFSLIWSRKEEEISGN